MENIDPFAVWIDIRDQEKLKLRPRLPGDRFQPLGMDGKSMKISDFMINEKIPKRARAGWPLVCSKDEIIWVPGYRLAHPFRVSKRSQKIVRMTLKQSRFAK
jgi:tRNA(Ile)-lysidine synthase